MNDLELEPFLYETVHAAQDGGPFLELLLNPVSIFPALLILLTVVILVVTVKGHTSWVSAYSMIAVVCVLAVLIGFAGVGTKLTHVKNDATSVKLQEWIEEKYNLPFTIEQINAMTPGQVKQRIGYEGKQLHLDGDVYSFVSDGKGLLLRKTPEPALVGILDQLPPKEQTNE